MASLNIKYDSLYERLVANTAEPVHSCACWFWTSSITKKGYGRVNLRRDGKHVQCLAHRVMFQLVFRPAVDLWQDDVLSIILPNTLEYDETVDHICEETTCVNPEHLRLLSRADNTKRSRGTL